MKALVALLVAMALISPVYAAEFMSYKIVADISEGEVVEELVIILYNDGDNELVSGSVSVPADSQIISVGDSYGALKYSTSIERGLRVNFLFTNSVQPEEERVILIKLKTKNLIKEQNGYFEYLLVFTPKNNVLDFEHVLRLPAGAELYSPEKSFAIVVPEANISKQEGTPTVTWKKELRANEPEVFLVRYKIGYKKVWNNAFLAVLAFLALTVIGFAGNKIMLGYEKTKTISSLKILNERERKVLEEIIKQDGIKQYELMNALGYTKASLSKILSKLESRGLIVKKKFGKVNKIYAGEKLK